MKKGVFILLLCGLTSGISAQKAMIKSIKHWHYQGEKSQLTREDFKLFAENGLVKLEEEYAISQGGDKQLKSKRKFTYDKQGRHNTTHFYGAHAQLKKLNKTHWDEYDNKVKVENIFYSEGEEKGANTVYELKYRADGEKGEEFFYNRSGDVTKNRKWFYNKNGDIIRTDLLEIAEGEKRKVKTDIELDEAGNLLKTIAIEQGKGGVNYKDVRTYENNYLSTWRKYVDDKLVSEFINEYKDSIVTNYDEQQLKKVSLSRTKEVKDEQTVIVEVKTERDEYGNVIKISEKKNGKLSSIIESTYDLYNNKTLYRVEDKMNKTIEEEQYEYDDYGQISRLKKFYNQQLISEDVYEYKYYPRF